MREKILIDSCEQKCSRHIDNDAGVAYIAKPQSFENKSQGFSFHPKSQLPGIVDPAIRRRLGLV